ncbi:MAG: hypothetical protein AAGI07_13655 [Bacteroidota bacterium]
MKIKTILFFFACIFLCCVGCEDAPEFEITQNILFLVGDEGEGKTWKLVRAEIPIETSGNAPTAIFDILNHPEFACFKDDNYTFLLEDSLQIKSGTDVCDDFFYENAAASWQVNEVNSPDPSILVISRSKENVTVNYDLPLNQINREHIISQLRVPMNEPLQIKMNDINATIYELDLTLFFESVETLNNGK